jgi:RimJ/RimL family protein N-acetyltransferase
MQQSVTTIQGDRVLLRPSQEGDAEEAARVWTPELRYMYGGSRVAPRRPAVAPRPAPKAPLDDSEHRFAVEADGRYIGHVGLRPKEEERSGSYRIGIVNPEYWGKGYGTEVTRLMLRYAFETLDLHRVHLRVTAYNHRGLRCYEKCGFRVEGVERHSFQVDGEWQNDVLMAILREEWEAQQARPSGDGEVTLRHYRASDYPQVKAIWDAAGWGEHNGSTAEAVTYKLLNSRGPFLVAEAVGQVVGTAMVSWDGRWGWASAVAVHPDYRRRGIARRLMAEAERVLTELGAYQICLLTNNQNAAAMGLYQSLGYESFDFVIYMRKKLTPEGRDCCGD